MSPDRLQELIRTATENGILPAGTLPVNATRPWPITLLISCCVWFAAPPLFLLAYFIFDDALIHGAVCYFLGSALLLGALVLLRIPSTSIFIEQLGMPLLLVGIGLLYFGFLRDSSFRAAGYLSATIASLLIAWLLPRDGIRALLGAIACTTFLFMLRPEFGHYFSGDWPQTQSWLSIQLGLLLWLCSACFADGAKLSGSSARHIAALESASTGWMLILLLAMIADVGRTFLSSAALEDWGPLVYVQLAWELPLQKATSLFLTALGIAWLMGRWRSLRSPLLLLAAMLLLILSWTISNLGSSLLMTAVCIATGRRQLAVACSITAAWLIGSFYYQLNLELATKATVMVGVGAAFSMLAWLGRHRIPRESVPKLAPNIRWWQQAGLGASLLATLTIANGTIWRKEDLINNGRPVFLELESVDPRSLMQGDYFALRFQMPNLGAIHNTPARRIKVIANVDERGVAIIQGPVTGQASKPHEIVIELQHNYFGLQPCTDAWYFKEGEAKRWSKARFGEFRIDADGKALLVGLRGERLEKL